MYHLLQSSTWYRQIKIKTMVLILIFDGTTSAILVKTMVLTKISCGSRQCRELWSDTLEGFYAGASADYRGVLNLRTPKGATK